MTLGLIWAGPHQALPQLLGMSVCVSVYWTAMPQLLQIMLQMASGVYQTKIISEKGNKNLFSCYTNGALF